MTRLAAPLGIAIVLVAIIAWENAGAPRTDVASLHPRATVMASPSPVLGEDNAHDWIITALARPLFSPDRRPAADRMVSAGPGLPGLPRLTAILVGPFGRSAIFAANGRKPIVVAEGARIDAYTVKSIEAAQVHIVGPEGTQTLHPTFQQGADGAAGAAASPQRPGRAPLPR